MPEADFFPASALNTRIVFEAVGVPVQLARAACALLILVGVVVALRVFALETQEQLRRARDELEIGVRERTAALQEALSEVKVLRGLLPMCAWRRRIRGEKDLWLEIETYIRDHTGALITHGICPDCQKELERRHAEPGVGAGGVTTGLRAPLARPRSPIFPATTGRSSGLPSTSTKGRFPGMFSVAVVTRCWVQTLVVRLH